MTSPGRPGTARPADRLAGKVAVITGTAGGQGRAAALLFAQAGASVVGADTDPIGAAETVHAVEAAGGSMTSLHPSDLTADGTADDLVALALSSYGRIDVLYNNAAHTVFSPFADHTWDAWNATITGELHLTWETAERSCPGCGAPGRAICGLHLWGRIPIRPPRSGSRSSPAPARPRPEQHRSAPSYRVTRAAWPHLLRAGGASVINVGSITAHRGTAIVAAAAHGAAKAGVLALTRQLALEGAPAGVRVNSITPGLIRTPVTADLLHDPAAAASATAAIPLGRIGTADDIAWAALFLASDESTFITGADLQVDGGALAVVL